MSLATSNRDGGRTNEAGHLRSVSKAILGQVLNGLNASQRGAGANMSVDIAIGDAVIQRSDGTYGHPAWNDAVYNRTIAAADGSNPRRDIVVMYIDYAQAPSTGVSNNTNGVVKIISVPGTAAGSPVDPSNATIQAAVGSGNPWIKLARVRLAAGATSVGNSVIDDLRELAVAITNNGWISIPNSEIASWAYASWSATNRIGVITVPTDATTKYAPGQRIRIVQATGGTKYGIIHGVTATTLTVFFPAGTTFNNEAILSPYYSREKAPFGFDLNPILWRVRATMSETANRAAGAYLNPSGVNIPVPMGAWHFKLNAVMSQDNTTAEGIFTRAAISTSASAASHTNLMVGMYGRMSNTSGIEMPVSVEDDMLLASQTTFYVNVVAAQIGGTTAIGILTGYNGDSYFEVRSNYL